jgi:Tfp pilus assembly protein PilF
MTRKAQVEAMLAEDPDNSLLRYALAMEHASEGDDLSALRELRELHRRDPGYVPAYLQAGRALTRLGEEDDARAILRTGIHVAQRAGDSHAAGEMQGLLESLGPES